MLLLIRHGQTDQNAQGRFISDTDAPLNAMGRAQARNVAAVLADFPIDRIVSSPRQRCLETAAAIAESNVSNATVTVDERLVELGLGSIEGLTPLDIDQRGDSDVFRAWRQGDPPRYPTGAETFEDAALRMGAVFAEATSDPGAVVALVGHSHALRILLATCVLGVPAGVHRRLRVDHASVTAVQWELDVPRLVALNGSAAF
jgi:probable phosphoglycerate mutase